MGVFNKLKRVRVLGEGQSRRPGADVPGAKHMDGAEDLRRQPRGQEKRRSSSGGFQQMLDC